MSETEQRIALNKQLDQLQKEVDGATKQRAVDEAKARAAKEAQHAKEKLIVSLEEALDTKRKLVSTTEKVIQETRANLGDVQAQYSKESKAVQALKDELDSMKGKLADAFESQSAMTDEEKEADVEVAQKIQALQSQADGLAAQLEEAHEVAGKSEQRLKDHEAKVTSMTRQQSQSSTEVADQEGRLSLLKDGFDSQSRELEALRARLAAESERNNALDERIREINARAFDARTIGEVGSLQAQREKEKAEATIRAQAEAMEKLEARLRAESRHKKALASQIAAIKRGETALDALDDSLSMSVMTSDSTSKVESMRSTVSGKTGAELALQKKIDRLSKEFAAAQKYSDKLTEMTSTHDWSLDGTMDSTISSNANSLSKKKGRDKKEEQVSGWFERMFVGADDETLSATEASMSTYEASIVTENSNSVVSKDTDAGRKRSGRRPFQAPSSLWRKKRSSKKKRRGKPVASTPARSRFASTCSETDYSSASSDKDTLDESTIGASTVGSSTLGTLGTLETHTSESVKKDGSPPATPPPATESKAADDEATGMGSMMNWLFGSKEPAQQEGTSGGNTLLVT